MIALAASLLAADPIWNTKRASEWTDADARQVLAASPWSKEIAATVTRRLTEDQLREGGQMGQPRGVGNDGVDLPGSGPRVSLNVLTGAGGEDRSARSLPRGLALKLRWESALPVRLAELKLREDASTFDEGYSIAVYGIPGPRVEGDPRALGKPLINLAALKREGKKDVKPVRAEVFQREDGAAVIYMFPASAEISRKDGRVQFVAQIGRIVIDHIYELSEMEFMGKLQL
jgi:hypothetical protein